MAITDRVGAALQVRHPPHEVTPRADRRPLETSSMLVAEFALSGLLGTAMVAVGSVSVGFVSPASGISTAPVIETLRLNSAFALVGWALVIIGVAVLLQAWLRLGHHVRTMRVSEPRGLLRLMWLWAIPLFIAPVLFSKDIFSYIAASRLLPAGLDPYANGTGALPTWTNDGADTFWLGSPSPYGPLWVGLSTGVYRVTGASAIPSLIAFRLLALAGLVLLAIYLPRLAKACGIDEAKVIWLGLLNPLVLLHFVSAGHNDALMLGLLVAGMTLALEGKVGLGTLVVILAGAIKAPALLGLPFVALTWPGATASIRSRTFAWVRVGAMALAVFLALNLALGIDFGWLSALDTPGEARTWLSPTTAVGMLGGIVGEITGHPNFDNGSVAVLRMLGNIAALALVAMLALHAERRTAARGLGLALLVVVVLGASVQPWYLLWALVILAAAGLSANENRVAVILSTVHTVYSIASSGSTNTYRWHLALNPGFAALLSLVIVGALLAASSRARAQLLDETVTHPEARGAPDSA
jgi:hypothetical protein